LKEFRSAMQKRGKQQFVAARAPRKAKKRQFEQFQATELYCPKCGQSMPVRQRLLLVLPEGDKYEYLCVRCGTSVGEKLDKGEPQPILIV
jgi:DNA-directed RNA polymerase subunit RPC12/RpoP